MADAAAESVRPVSARLPRRLPAFAAAVATPLAVVAGSTLLSLPGRWNDFASYWLAGRLLEQGANPYDLGRLEALARREHVEFLLGTGYSYPLPFAVTLIPLSRLPFEMAAWVFVLASIVAFGVAVAVWVDALAPQGDRGRLLVAFGAGFYPPVAQSAYYGQANLLVVALLAAGLLPLARRARGAQAAGPAGVRGGVAGVLVGLAGLVKLVPLTLVVPLALGRRAAMAVGLAGAALIAVLAAGLAFPRASGTGSLVSQLFSPDVFWTNQSINGFASRLVEPSERTVPLAVGVPTAPLVAALTAAMALAVLALLWRVRRGLSSPRVLALATAAVLVAAVAAAPKDSFWNHAQAIVGVGLLLAVVGVRDLLAWRPEAILVAAWYAAAVAQNLLDQTHGSLTRTLGPIGSVASSTALLGLLALFAAITIALERFGRAPAESAE